jgi:hypothetical protein
MGRRERKRWVQQGPRPRATPGRRGGPREGAGRPRKPGSVSHRRREVLKVRTPLHVVARCGEEVRGLRRGWRRCWPGCSGPVVREADSAPAPQRYHSVRLGTARQVRAALCHVLQNARRHGLDVPTGSRDMYSSAWWFKGWTHDRWRASWKPPRAPTVVATEGWLLKDGRRRWGLIGVDEVPPAARRSPHRAGAVRAAR